MVQGKVELKTKGFLGTVITFTCILCLLCKKLDNADYLVNFE